MLDNIVQNIETFLSVAAAVILFITTRIEKAAKVAAQARAIAEAARAGENGKAAKLAVALAESFAASVPRSQAKATKSQIAALARDAGCFYALESAVFDVTKGPDPCVDAAGRIDGRKAKAATSGAISAVDKDGNRIGPGPAAAMVFLFVLLSAGCGSIPDAHAEADEAFMRRFDPEYREMIRKVKTLNSGPVTAETIQAREDLIDAQWDEIRKLRAGKAK